MADWHTNFRVDPFPALLSSEDPALRYFTRRDLLGEQVESIESLWELPEACKIVRKQRSNGSWRSRGKTKYEYPTINSDLAETLRSVNSLVNQYGFDQQHPAIHKAADYFFSCQTEEGDIRGILGTQYMPYYNGLILEQLIKAGFAADDRLEHCMRWLVAYRQQDGGWMIPIQEVWSQDRSIYEAPPVPFEKSKPASFIATGMVFRAFAFHPAYRDTRVTKVAAELLKPRFFQSDPHYTSMGRKEQWTKFKFPTWWPNLLTILDGLAWMGYSPQDEDVQKGLVWFIDNQGDDGLWKTGFSGTGDPTRIWIAKCWIGLAVCRVFRRFYES